MYIIITETAANEIASHSKVDFMPPFVHGAMTLIYNPSKSVISTAKDRRGCRFAAVSKDMLKKLPANSAREAFIRISRALRASARFPVRLPTTWSEYHYRSYLSFFAIPREWSNERWIAQIDESQSALFFHEFSTGASFKLETYQAPETPAFRAVVDDIVKDYREIPDRELQQNIVEQCDFQAIGSSAISSNKSIDAWLPILTTEQNVVVDLPTEESIRIVGQAGSGKTLALCIKAICEIRKDRAQNRTSKILFITHSWAMAERVDDTLRTLNGGHYVDDIVVYPLLEILREVVGKSNIGSLEILGDDSTEGRKQQLDIIKNIVANIPTTDLTMLRTNRFSSLIEAALSAPEKSRQRIDFIENIYLEINGVLLAEAILPGNMQKIKDYISQKRPEELPPFVTEGDRYLVIYIYDKFLKELQEGGFITTDQLVSDATKMMETFSWHARKSAEGYDRIFIDELQYFDAQERFAAILLASDPNTVSLITAEDPSQGLFSSVSPSWNRDVSSHSKRIEVELTNAHRFSEGILQFIKHLYLSFPLNAANIGFKRTSGNNNIPDLYLGIDAKAAIDIAVKIATGYAESINNQERIAVICLDNSGEAIYEMLRNDNKAHAIHIQGLDDIENLSFSKKSIVVGEWRYLGGTQFSHVVVVNTNDVVTQGGFAHIRELTALYVAASRASHRLSIVAVGQLLGEIKSAVQQQLLVERQLL